MSSSQERESALFALALEKPVAERAAFLDAVCGADNALRQRLEALFAANEQPDSILTAQAQAARPTMKLDIENGPDEAVGQTIGRYKLLERIGEGGCGVVYVAEQTEPVRRRVALKVIKLGMDTKAVVARFEAERQALAMMDHPNIAKVLDAGTTGSAGFQPAVSPTSSRQALSSERGARNSAAPGEIRAAQAGSTAIQQTGSTGSLRYEGPIESGRPFFVMELVRGIRITEYCDQANLSTKDRLDLFMKVCHAIQHAHQKGIIHRDIKPSNILVTLHDGVPVPKVIDFGIAKATEGRLTDATVYTQLHQFIGTPAYMSPEQAEMSGLDIDTRSDIYSLGVLLYELLAGSTPFDGKELIASGIDAMRRTIREKEPMRPSTRLATLKGEELTTTAKRRSTDTTKLLHQLKGDLDWIVMKCLEKDRTRRYETANGLAADLKRYLGNEPVVARPPSAAYRFQKFVRRNKVMFAAASVVVLAVLGGLSLATVGLVRERQARAEADGARQAEVEQRHSAEQARADEAAQRRLAEANAVKATENERHSRRLLYAADMNLAQQAVELNNLGRARRLLDRHRPAPGEEDLRGWEWRYLWQQSRSGALAVLTQGTSRGFSVSFSPDGTRLAAGYSDGRVELWDVPRRALLKILHSEGGFTRGAVAFAPQANLLATVAGTNDVKLHDLSTGGERILDQLPKSAVIDLSFSPDGSRLVVFQVGLPVKPAAYVVDVAQGRVLSTNITAGQRAQFTGVARLSGDHQRLYISHGDNSTRQLTIRCLNHETGQEIWSAEAGADRGVTAMALSPNGQVLVTGNGYDDPVIRVWDAGSGKLLTRLEKHTGWIGELAFSRDGRWLASAAGDHSIRLWDASNWTEVTVFRGHGDEVHAVAFSPDGQFLASGSKDGAILLWDVGARQSTGGHRTLSEALYAHDLSPGQANEVSPGTLLDFDPVGPFHATVLSLKNFTREPVQFSVFDTNHSVYFSPPNFFAFYDRTNWLRVYEVRHLTPTLLGELEVGVKTVEGRYGPITGFAYSPTNRLVAWAAGASNTAQIMNLDSPTQRLNLNLRFLPIMFSPDGKLLTVAGLEKMQIRLLVLEVTNGKTVLSLNIDHGTSLPIFANHGRRLALWNSETSGGVVAFYDLLRPEKTPIEFRERGVISGLTASPDGRLVAAGSEAGTVVLYDAERMERKSVLHGHMHAVRGINFSPDGKRLISSSDGQEAVKIWPLETGQELLTLRGTGSTLTQVGFVDNGNAILVGSPREKGTWQIWRAPTWEEIAAAEAKQKAGIKEP